MIQSATRAGLSLPSISTATAVRIWMSVADRLVSSRSVNRPRTRDPVGTGVTKRTRSKP